MNLRLRPKAAPEAEQDDALATQIGTPSFGPFETPAQPIPSSSLHVPDAATDAAPNAAAPDAAPGPAPDAAGAGILVIGPGHVFAGRYRIITKIARGGMSTVWEAVDERIDRVVALKLMSPHLADEPDYCVRFEQEARAAARLACPNVVALHDYGIHEGLPYMVLERLAGEDLLRRSKRVGALGLEETRTIIAQTALALHAAHRAGIVHRDVKPQNLFLAEAESGEVVKLLDFGVAKHAGTAGLRTKTGLMVGSPYFMSPEQVRGVRDIDLRTDLFSLGAVAYLCLTGRTPFVGAMPTVFLSILEGRPPRATSLRPGLPPALDAFFERALALDPSARFGSALELSRALEAAIDGGVAPGPLRVPSPSSHAHPAVPAPSPAPAVARLRPRIVIEDDDAPRPSEFPTAISAVPEEVLRGHAAVAVVPPAGAAAAADPVPTPPAAAPAAPAARPRRPEVGLPAVMVEPHLADGDMAPRSSALRDRAGSVDAPGFSIAMRAYQPSAWANPPARRPPPSQRFRASVPLILASMIGFVCALVVLVVVWALMG